MSSNIVLIQSIRDFLAGIAGDWSTPELAASFATQRDQAASRLLAFAATLETGDEYEALKLAEREPRLPDSIAQLTFVEEPQWLEYCQRNQLPRPAPLHQDALQFLQKLYLRGITTTSPFYQDCLAAIAAGDDDQALQLIRSIVRLNPRDEGARCEMERRLYQKAAPQLAQMRQAMEQNNQDGILWLLGEIEKLGNGYLIEQDETYQMGLAVRSSVKLDKSITEVEVQLRSLETQQQQGNWRIIPACVERIQRLAKDSGVTFTSKQASRLQQLEAYAAQQSADAGRHSESHEALGVFSAFADRVKLRLQSGPTLGLSEAQRLTDTYKDHWIKMEQLSVSIAEADLLRLNEIYSALQRKLELCRKSDSTTHALKIAVISPIILIFLVVIGASYLYTNARRQVEQLEGLQQKNLAKSAHKLIAMMNKTAMASISAVPGLKEKMDKVKGWVNFEMQKAADAEAELLDLEHYFDEGIEEITAEELLEEINGANDQVRELLPELSLSSQTKLAQIQHKMKVRFDAMRTKNIKTAKALMPELEQRISSLHFSTPAAELVPQVAATEAVLKKADLLRHPKIPALHLPLEIEQPLEKLSTVAKPFSFAIASLTTIKQAMANARTLQAYRKALEQYAALPLEESKEANAVLEDFPTEDVVAARLLFEGHLDIWQIAQAQIKAGYKLLPNNTSAEEIRQLTAVYQEPALNAPNAAKDLLQNLHLNQIFDAEGTRCQTSLIQVVDAIVRAPKSSLIVKAYLLQKLYALMKARPAEWGLHYCTQLVADMENLHATTHAPLRSDDCNQTATLKKLGPNLKRFFESIATQKPYFEMASYCHDLAAKLTAAGIRFAGYVDEKHSANLSPDVPLATEYWGAATEPQGAPTPIDFNDRRAKPGDLVRLQKWSPLFVIPPEARQLNQTQLNSAR